MTTYISHDWQMHQQKIGDVTYLEPRGRCQRCGLAYRWDSEKKRNIYTLPDGKMQYGGELPPCKEVPIET